MAACRSSDMLVVAKLDRFARSVTDARDIVDELTRQQVKLNIGGSVDDRTDPLGRLLFNVLAMVEEFEADPLRARTREGMAVARAKGSAIELVERAPFLDEVRLQTTKADVLDEDGEDVAYTGGRGRVDTVCAEGMRDDAQILAGGPVGTGEHVHAEADLGAHLAVGEVEDSVELDLVAVEDPRE